MVLFSLAIALALGEGVARLFFKDPTVSRTDERNLAYRYDPTLGWFPAPNTTRSFTGTRPITLHHNRRGFRGPDPVLSDKPRVVVLGDSFTWGYDVEEPDRFTEKIQARHPEWAVYNLGVSGYGTDQEYLLLQREFAFYQPQLVLLIVCVANDTEDNSWSARYGYFKPWFANAGGQLTLHGVPVPKDAKNFAAEHPLLWHSRLLQLGVADWFKVTCPFPEKHADPTAAILAEMQRYVKDHGAKLVAGLEDDGPTWTPILDRLDIPWVSLATTNRFPANGRHWTPAGHTFVADTLAHKLEEGHYLAPQAAARLSTP
jgi:lysophospholipase L1-like esterase